jgi:predicted ester cyclase
VTLEQNKALARRELQELWSEGNLAVADEIFAPNFVSHQHSRPDAQDVRGVAAYKAFVREVHEAFPDLHYVLEDQIAEADKVMTRNVASGTHKGWLMGIEPTNKRAQWTGAALNFGEFPFHALG